MRPKIEDVRSALEIALIAVYGEKHASLFVEESVPSVEITDTGIGICLSDDEKDEKLYVFEAVSIPGIRYCRDGSGIPDDVDYRDLDVISNGIDAAVARVLEHHNRVLIDCYFEVKRENELFARLEAEQRLEAIQ